MTLLGIKSLSSEEYRIFWSDEEPGLSLLSSNFVISSHGNEEGQSHYTSFNWCVMFSEKVNNWVRETF